tara:strand:- start:5572 stop:6354 length:783 start_codon:yes stop_codon:yes gene_type:complete
MSNLTVIFSEMSNVRENYMTFHVYVGYDAINHLAYRVLEASILDQTKETIIIHPLRDWQVRMEGYYWREYKMLKTGQKWDILDERPHSTEFSYTRFLTPLIHRAKNRTGPALFMDADMMVRGDLAELFYLSDHNYEVQVVQHDYNPVESTKIVAVEQQLYDRKNWSSMMLFANSYAIQYTEADVNRMNRDWLHQLRWANKIGDIDKRWNWLEGWHDKDLDPLNVHFTRGTPDLPNWGKVDFAKEYWRWAKLAGWRGHNSL